ncbi:MAG: UDP-N-acetylglucosamine 1-carboxyvinyltransferase [Ruminococcaceae bacterium]|nr:UDP-N-acetylglucosamine 1-carboxyvinyltransferase [Oscillospiraceae bacterium]
MEKIVIHGGSPLVGTIGISGMKNAALPIIMGCVLVKDECIIENLPEIHDVTVSLQILEAMGVKIRMIDRNTVAIDATHAQCGSSPLGLVNTIRASYYLMGAELGRFGRSRVGYPGGCDFGVRPIDQHLKGFRALGATADIVGGYVDASTEDGLKGSHIFFDLVSVGATINVMLAACMAEGFTEIENAAKEPHVVDLANFLNACGADIKGAGTDTIRINGVPSLHGCTYAIIPDMIEAGTYMIAAAATHGDLTITDVIPKHLDCVSAKLREMGVTVEEGDDWVRVSLDRELKPTNVKTMPYPGYPTDMQPQISILMCLAKGTSTLRESVFDNRFRYIDELLRMGANVKVDGKTAIFQGGGLTAARVRAVDLRAGAAMVIAGLAVAGRTEIDNIHLIERGYDHLIEKLQAVGAMIAKMDVKESVTILQAE